MGIDMVHMLSLPVWGLIAALISPTPDTPSGNSSAMSRTDFAQAIRSVKLGMTERAAWAILGAPDEVRSNEVDEASESPAWSKVWYYGTSGKGTFPTLGRVYFNRPPPQESKETAVVQVEGDVRNLGRVYFDTLPAEDLDELVVVRTVGGRPPCLPPNMTEDQLRAILQVLGRHNECHGLYYNPQATIAAVNVLQPLGKVSALLVIEEYVRLCPASHFAVAEKIGMVLRVLFNVPCVEGHMPPLLIGAFEPEPPADRRTIPRFPLAIVRDIPFLVVLGYSTGGEPASPDADIAYFREFGQLRAKPLVPTNNPLGAVKELQDTPSWTYVQRPEGAQIILVCQLLRVLKPSGMLDDCEDIRERAHDAVSSPASWSDFEADICQEPLKWHRDKQRYVSDPSSHKE